MLPTNYELANKRFENLLKGLEKHPELFATYHQIIHDQFKEGIVETAPQISNKPGHWAIPENIHPPPPPPWTTLEIL